MFIMVYTCFIAIDSLLRLSKQRKIIVISFISHRSKTNTYA